MSDVVWDTPLGAARIKQWEADALAAIEAEKARAPARGPRAPRAPTLGEKMAAQSRMYASARPSRLRSDFNPSDSSADAELVQSLTSMRSRSRALIRDSGLAFRAQDLVQINVVGNGIGTQFAIKDAAGTINKKLNDELETEWCDWTLGSNCHMGRRLAFSLIERWAMGQVFAAGECLIRKHPVDLGSGIPLALEVIEAERLADEFTSPQVSPETGNEVRMGVEVDEFFAPVAYYIRDRHPNEYRFRAGSANSLRRVPANQIIHLALCDRWPQTRGEPWLHTTISRINDMDGYVESELYRARTQAATHGAIETPESVDSFGDPNADGSATMDLEPGVIKRLNPGEKLSAGPMNSPNPQLDPFMRFLIREMAAGSRLSYESLSRDYSQSNYSSSRLALLDDRDIWRFLQAWFITDFRQKIHTAWLEQAILSGAIPIRADAYAANPRQYRAVRYKPRGWTWVDPAKEVAAYKDAVKCGFTTVTDVIAQTAGGQDFDDVMDTREHELETMDEKGLVFETSPDFYMQLIAPTPGAAPAAADGTGDTTGAANEPTPAKPARTLRIAR